MLERFLSKLGRPFTVPELQGAYQMAFRTGFSERWVLPDLAEFCRASEPAPRESDLFVQGRAAGRRDVWLHINEILRLTEEELASVYKGRAFPKNEGKYG